MCEETQRIDIEIIPRNTLGIISVSKHLDLLRQSLNGSMHENMKSRFFLSMPHFSYHSIRRRWSLAHAYLIVPLEIPQLMSPSWLHKLDNIKMDVLMKNCFCVERFGIRDCEPSISNEDKRAMEIVKSITNRVDVLMLDFFGGRYTIIPKSI